MPIAVLLDERDEFFDGLRLGDILQHALLALVEADAVDARADVAIVRVRHLARSIDDAAHNADFQALQMRRGRFYPRDSRLQVVERPSAAGAGDILRLADAPPRGLQDREGRAPHLRLGDMRSDEQEAVCPAVDEERTGIDSRLELEVLCQRVVVVPPDDDGEGDAGVGEFPEGGALLVEAVFALRREDEDGVPHGAEAFQSVVRQVLVFDFQKLVRVS